MLPFFRDGESVLVVRTRFRWNRLRRGDLVVFTRPTGSGGTTIKRVVGLPGEDIKLTQGQVFVDGQLLGEDHVREPGGVQEGEWFNGPDEYFLLGDNRAESTDSRSFGPISGESIIAVFRGL